MYLNFIQVSLASIEKLILKSSGAEMTDEKQF